MTSRSSTGSGEATLQVVDLGLEDYFTIDNSLSDDPSVEATASYRVDWLGAHGHFKIRDQDQSLAGNYVEGLARVEWSASNEDGFHFVSDPASTSSTVFAVIGSERNGVFFS